MDGPRILIGIPCQMQGGFRPFEVTLAKLRWRPVNFDIFYAMTGVLPGCRNRIVREALRSGADYIWFLDDDQPFDAGLPDRDGDLDKLLAHQLDAVIPLSCRRGAPFLPLIYSHIHEEGWIATQRYLEDDESGLIQVAAAGMAGLLIKTECFHRIGTDGWFEFIHPPDNFDDYSEDLGFYRKLQNAGIQVYCDLDVRFGHAVTSVAYIVKQQGKWVTVLADHEPFVAFPQPSHPLGLERPRSVGRQIVLQ